VRKIETISFVRLATYCALWQKGGATLIKIAKCHPEKMSGVGGCESGKTVSADGKDPER